MSHDESCQESVPRAQDQQLEKAMVHEGQATHDHPQGQETPENLGATMFIHSHPLWFGHGYMCTKEQSCRQLCKILTLPVFEAMALWHYGPDHTGCRQDPQGQSPSEAVQHGLESAQACA